MGFYDFVHTAPAPQPKRVEDAFEITGQKRLSNNWQFLASAVFSKLEGNYDGTFQASTGQLDPNINSAFDYADFLVNAQGRLSNDRNVQLKFLGTYEVSSGPVTRAAVRHRHALVRRHAAQRVRLFHGVQQLGVLPGAARLGRTRAERLGSGPARLLSAATSAARAGWT